jgi:hypothetical protein
VPYRIRSASKHRTGRARADAAIARDEPFLSRAHAHEQPLASSKPP